MPTVAERFAEFMTPPRRRAAWAIGVAVGIHLVILLMAAALLPLLPDGRNYAPANQERPFEIQVERPTPPPAAEEEKKKSLDYIPTNPNQKAASPPENPDFQSSEDTKAESTKDGEAGKPPLPTMDGRDLPFFAFDTKRNVEGDKAADIASKENPAAAPTPPPVPLPPQPPVMDTTPPRPQPNLKATPAPPTPRPTAGPKELAMLAPQPTPPPTPPPAESMPRPTQLPSDLFRRPTPVPRAAAPPSVASPGTQQLPVTSRRPSRARWSAA